MYYLFILLGIVILFLMSRRSNPDNVKKLIKQAARYATTAQQDSSSLKSLLHANYAAAYLLAAKDIASTREIHSATSIDVKKFEEHIVNVQEMVTDKVIKKCPEIVGQVDMYLSSIADLSES